MTRVTCPLLPVRFFAMKKGIPFEILKGHHHFNVDDYLIEEKHNRIFTIFNDGVNRLR